MKSGERNSRLIQKLWLVIERRGDVACFARAGSNRNGRILLSCSSQADSAGVLVLQ